MYPARRKIEPFTSDQQDQDCIFTCKLLCCKCSICNRVATKERRKSQLLLQYRNKACERCFRVDHFNLREGKVRPTPECWQTLTDKILSILSGPVCPVRQFISLIGLLTATEKQVHLGRLHMRPIQWHLKNNWRVPESLEKVIPVPRSLHPHLRWWLEESNVLLGQPLHPLKHALQIFTDASKEGWGAHLNKRTARGTW